MLTLFALLVVTAIGLSMMFQTDTETAINANFRDQQVGYYAAAAGLEEGRDRMMTGNSAVLTLPTVLPGSASGALYITNASGSETVAPWSTSNTYYDNEICKELNCGGSLLPAASPYYTSTTASSTYAANPVIPYKWTRLTRKINRSAAGTTTTMYVNGGSDSATWGNQVCWDGTHEIAMSGTTCSLPYYPVYLLTTLAVTPSGTRRMLQYEVTQNSLGITLPSALTLVGGPTTATTNWPNSAVFQIDGTDHNSCGGTATSTLLPAVGLTATNATNLTAIKNDLPKPGNYTGLHAAPDVEDISSTTPSNLQSVTALEALLATIKSKATAAQRFTTNQTGLANPGTAASPQIIYVDADLSISGSLTGFGILVVTGTFSPSGNVGWKGLILVVGKGIVIGNGGGNNEYDGAMIVAKTRDSLGNLLSSPGIPTFQFNGGGGNGVKYSSGCIAQGQKLPDYKLISAHELAY